MGTFMRTAAKFKRLWSRAWLNRAGPRGLGKVAAYLAAVFSAPYYHRVSLSKLHYKGYISPRATIFHSDLRLGKHCYIDDRVLIYKDREGGIIELADGVHIHRDTIIQTGLGGQVLIGADTHIQPRCQFSAYKSTISIGQRVEIAPNCAFYPYDHVFNKGKAIREQPLRSRGGIIVKDDVWFGFGVIVLDGVRIGEGAVVGAGAVVSKDIPAKAVAVGVPARVVKMRTDLDLEM
jgi:acetyltransferase-like isoleucine patch superfamily enzyme